MKYKILVMLLLISSLTISQQAHRQYISLSFGPSFPIGDFSKTNINDSTSGWAKTGVAINISSVNLTIGLGYFFRY